MKATIQDYFASCTTYRQAKDHMGKPKEWLLPLATQERLRQTLSLDFIVELSPSKGFISILVVADTFTKMAHFASCHGAPTAQQTADLFLQHVFCYVGSLHISFPTGVHSLSLISGKPCAGDWVYRSIYPWPTEDGRTERINWTLEQYLQCFATYQQDNWSYYLP